eukprot:TRINITY_DN67477_c0_g1_i1.p1 TRINITY_DN67477_c0_g1~~TRINITY_DN67477_c0_g1_i1.p1  ORF type:complete len:145 (-),score=9.58 TRINITY_DN67477_c0_g1_i1:229-663(-)
MVSHQCQKARIGSKRLVLGKCLGIIAVGSCAGILSSTVALVTLQFFQCTLSSQSFVRLEGAIRPGQSVRQLVMVRAASEENDLKSDRAKTSFNATEDLQPQPIARPPNVREMRQEQTIVFSVIFVGLAIAIAIIYTMPTSITQN